MQKRVLTLGHIINCFKLLPHILPFLIKHLRKYSPFRILQYIRHRIQQKQCNWHGHSLLPNTIFILVAKFLCFFINKRSIVVFVCSWIEFGQTISEGLVRVRVFQSIVTYFMYPACSSLRHNIKGLLLFSFFLLLLEFFFFGLFYSLSLG